MDEHQFPYAAIHEGGGGGSHIFRIYRAIGIAEIPSKTGPCLDLIEYKVVGVLQARLDHMLEPVSLLGNHIHRSFVPLLQKTIENPGGDYAVIRVILVKFIEKE